MVVLRYKPALCILHKFDIDGAIGNGGGGGRRAPIVGAIITDILAFQKCCASTGSSLGHVSYGLWCTALPPEVEAEAEAGALAPRTPPPRPFTFGAVDPLVSSVCVCVAAGRCASPLAWLGHVLLMLKLMLMLLPGQSRRARPSASSCNRSTGRRRGRPSRLHGVRESASPQRSPPLTTRQPIRPPAPRHSAPAHLCVRPLQSRRRTTGRSGIGSPAGRIV